METLPLCTQRCATQFICRFCDSAIVERATVDTPGSRQAMTRRSQGCDRDPLPRITAPLAHEAPPSSWHTVGQDSIRTSRCMRPHGIGREWRAVCRSRSVGGLSHTTQNGVESPALFHNSLRSSPCSRCTGMHDQEHPRMPESTLSVISSGQVLGPRRTAGARKRT